MTTNKRFPDDLNENNYFRFEGEYPTYLIIYPINLSGVEMITEKQYKYIKDLMYRNENSNIFVQEKMYEFVTKKLAHKIIDVLEGKKQIQMSFSKQAETDAMSAYKRFTTKINEINN